MHHLYYYKSLDVDMCVFPEKTPKLLDNWLAWIGQLLLHFVELYLSDYLKKNENRKGGSL